MTDTEPRYTFAIPGAFDSWFSGSSPAQGCLGPDEPAGYYDLQAAYAASTTRRHGRGYQRVLSLTLAGVEALRDYAEAGWYGARDSEEDARPYARVFRECERALDRYWAGVAS